MAAALPGGAHGAARGVPRLGGARSGDDRDRGRDERAAPARPRAPPPQASWGPHPRRAPQRELAELGRGRGRARPPARPRRQGSARRRGRRRARDQAPAGRAARAASTPSAPRAPASTRALADARALPAASARSRARASASPTRRGARSPAPCVERLPRRLRSTLVLGGLDEWLHKLEAIVAARRWTPAEIGLTRWRAAAADQYLANDAAAAAAGRSAARASGRALGSAGSARRAQAAALGARGACALRSRRSTPARARGGGAAPPSAPSPSTRRRAPWKSTRRAWVALAAAGGASADGNVVPERCARRLVEWPRGSPTEDPTAGIPASGRTQSAAATASRSRAEPGHPFRPSPTASS